MNKEEYIHAIIPIQQRIKINLSQSRSIVNSLTFPHVINEELEALISFFISYL